jgi:hypothetical protein
MSARSAVQLAQAILAGAGADIKQDGILGSETIGAFEKASPAAKAQVRESVRRYESLDWDELVASWRASEASKKSRTKKTEKSAPAAAKRPVAQVAPAAAKRPVTQVAGTFAIKPTKFISRDAAYALARRFNIAANLPSGTLEYMLDFEAEKMTGGYDASFRGGSGDRYLGLYQFFDDPAAAWADGTRNAATFGFRVAPMYPEGWKDPEHNTACAAGYAVMNRSILRRAGLPVTKETLYACHQQGAGAFIASVKSRKFVVAGPQSGDGRRAVYRAYQIATA